MTTNVAQGFKNARIVTVLNVGVLKQTFCGISLVHLVIRADQTTRVLSFIVIISAKEKFLTAPI